MNDECWDEEKLFEEIKILKNLNEDELGEKFHKCFVDGIDKIFVEV
jgi:hypothetical protein